MGSFSWDVELKDKITPPAKQAAKTLEHLDKTLKAVLGSVGKLDKANQSFTSHSRAMVAGLNDIGKAAERTAKKLAGMHNAAKHGGGGHGFSLKSISSLKGLSSLAESGGKGLGGLLGGAAGGLVGGIIAEAGMKALEMGVELGKKIVEVSIEFVKQGLESVEFKQTSIAKFAGEFGEKGGEQFFNFMEKFSHRSNLGPEALQGVADKFLGIRGIGASQLSTLVMGVADLTSRHGTKSGPFAEKLAESIARGLEGHKIRWKGLNQASAGTFTEDKALAVVQQLKHVSRITAESMLGGTYGSTYTSNLFAKVTKELFRQANGGGALGSQSGTQATYNASRQVDILKESWTQLFEDINTTDFASTLAGINAQLERGTPMGDKLRASLESVFDAFTRPFIDRWKDPDKLIADLNTLNEILQDMAHAAGVISQSFILVLDAANWITGTNKSLGLSNVPGHADGGITTGDHIARVGERGPELILPLHRAHDVIGKALRSGGAGQGGVHTGNISVPVTIEGGGKVDEEMAQHVADLTAERLVAALEQLALQGTGGIA